MHLASSIMGYSAIEIPNYSIAHMYYFLKYKVLTVPMHLVLIRLRLLINLITLLFLRYSFLSYPSTLISLYTVYRDVKFFLESFWRGFIKHTVYKWVSENHYRNTDSVGEPSPLQPVISSHFQRQMTEYVQRRQKHRSTKSVYIAE